MEAEAEKVVRSEKDKYLDMVCNRYIKQADEDKVITLQEALRLIIAAQDRVANMSEAEFIALRNKAADVSIPGDNGVSRKGRCVDEEYTVAKDPRSREFKPTDDMVTYLSRRLTLFNQGR